MKVISIGDLVIDYYYKKNKLVGVNGGMSSHNIIANISQMGLETAIYGVCGNDIQGKTAIKSLQDLGINVENIEVIDNLKTRCFHISYFMDSKKSEFKSKKRCSFCNKKKWYDESQINTKKIIKKINADDVLVFDNLNIKNQTIIDKCNNIKMLDLGQYFELDKYNKEEIVDKISGKFDIINLNERVYKYLLLRYSFNTLNEIYNLFKPKLLIVTKGNKGSDFIYNNLVITKLLENSTKEVDSTGAGDAFFSVFICEYINNNFEINEEFINKTFDKAIKLTKKVVKKFGARGHIQNLYKIKKIKDFCSCDNFELTVRKKIKRCNINVNNLETRLINALNSKAYKKLKAINFNELNNCIFIGTGGSFASAKFSEKLINYLYGINTQALLPRNFYYRNNDKIDKIFLFSYSGTTNDLIVGTSLIDNNKKIIVTKGEIKKIVTKTEIPEKNIISYRNNSNKGKERGFLSFEGAIVPASLFLKLYFENNGTEDMILFIKNCVQYWKNYFDNYFKNNIDFLTEFLKLGNCFNIFTGDFTESISIDLESKIIESGVYNCIIHEKKNFSHGRFINYEHLSEKKNIYLKSKTISSYEKKLIDYLKSDSNVIIENRFDGILCEFDLLLASQYFAYYISNFINIDISKPSYSEEAIKIYSYKGKL